MKTYNSKKEFETKNPYVIVEFNVYEGKTIATILESCSTRKVAENWMLNNVPVQCHNVEVMTRKQYMKNALMCM